MEFIIISSKEEISQIVSDAVKENINPILDRIEGASAQPEWLSRKEYAEKHRISLSLVDKLKRAGKLETKKISRRTLIKNV